MLQSTLVYILLLLLYYYYHFKFRCAQGCKDTETGVLGNAFIYTHVHSFAHLFTRPNWGSVIDVAPVCPRRERGAEGKTEV